MAYTAPTPADLKAVFPKFAGVPNDTVQYWITRAMRTVDATWTEGDYAHAIMLLACHYMTLRGLGGGAEAAASAAGAEGFKVMSSGTLRLERFDPPANGSGSGAYASTAYGREFAILLRQNRGAGPRVTDSGSIVGVALRYPHGEA